MGDHVDTSASFSSTCSTTLQAKKAHSTSRRFRSTVVIFVIFSCCVALSLYSQSAITFELEDHGKYALADQPTIISPDIPQEQEHDGDGDGRTLESLSLLLEEGRIEKKNNGGKTNDNKLASSMKPATAIIREGQTTLPSTSSVANIASRRNQTSADLQNQDPFRLLDDVVRLFLPADQAEEYISQNPSRNFRFYVYDLGWDLSWQNTFRCVEGRYRPKNMTYTQFHEHYCDWGATICNPKFQSSDKYSTRRMNRNSDGVLTKLFSEYKGPMRTYDPQKASMFVVPYAANARYECLHKRSRQQAQEKTSFKAHEEHLLPLLKYWKTSNSSHFFFQSTDGSLHRFREPVVATVNTPQMAKGEKHFIIPYVNTNRQYQPDILVDLDENEQAFDEFFSKKNYSLAAIMASKISGNSRIRVKFMNESDELFGNEIGGLPVYIQKIQNKRKLSNEEDVMSLYRHSVFCPTLRGDSPNQKRFFDVILSGCIPVVLAYRSQWESEPNANDTSYFSTGVSTTSYLPFSKGSFENHPDMGIDYSDLVVEVEANCGLACIKPALEALMKDQAALRQKQKAVARYAKLFSYGLEHNAWKHTDAVMALLVHARHEITNRPSKNGHTKPTKKKRRTKNREGRDKKSPPPFQTDSPRTYLQQNSSHHEVAFSILDEVVRMFLPPEKASEYISIHPAKDFQFYVYDLGADYGWKSVFECVENRYRPKHKSSDEFVSEHCDWGATICNPTLHSPDSQYSSRRMNRNSDGVLTKLFSEYDGPLRTHDPNKASMFVVPYASNALFECYGGRKLANKKTSLKALQSTLFPKLAYWNASKASHFFFQSTMGSLHHLRQPVVATVNTPQKLYGGKQFIMPYVNTNYEYQPSNLVDPEDGDAFEGFITKKNLSMVAIMATQIKGYGHIRQQFMNQSDQLFGNEIGGLPVYIHKIESKRKLPDEQDAMNLYRHSIFCPCLRGDSPNQKRFFDVLLSGCIPVVLTYKWPSKPEINVNFTSYFTEGIPTSTYLPFAKGSFENEPEMGVDYSDLVVEVDGRCGIPCLKPTLEALMKNLKELRRKQKAVARYAKMFAYGLEHNAWKHIDAVAALLVHARHEIMARRQASVRS